MTRIRDQNLLDKYRLKPNDAILAEDAHRSLFDDLIEKYSAQTTAGGGAQNTARGAQYCLPPSSVVYIGCVGRDSYADALLAACQQAGVQAEYHVDDAHPSGRCGAVITDQNRSLCTELGAANHYKLNHLKQPRIWDIVQKAKVYFVGGYHLTVCPEAALALAQEAAAHNKVFAMSLSAPFIPTEFKEVLVQTEPYWDYIVGNESEARAWAQSHGLKTDDIPTIAQRMANLPKANSLRPRVAIVTQGTSHTVYAESEMLSQEAFLPASYKAGLSKHAWIWGTGSLILEFKKWGQTIHFQGENINVVEVILLPLIKDFNNYCLWGALGQVILLMSPREAQPISCKSV
ncbi:adenosine kinase [Aspergillus sp. HF37]|nr:adenosine kinase [Aspergillus sp. HF37]